MPTAGDRRRANQERENKIRSSQAQFTVKNFESPDPGETIPIGVLIRAIESSKKNAEIINNWFVLPFKKFFEHILIIGQPGCGKTFLLLWLAFCIIFNKKEEIDLVVVDAKGSSFFQKMICLMVKVRGWGSVPTVRVGWPDEDVDGNRIKNSAVFNVFAKGSSRAIWNRLVELYDLRLKGEESDHYRIFRRNMLQRVCGYNMEVIYPHMESIPVPRSLKIVWERLTPEWMWEHYPEMRWNPDSGAEGKKAKADLQQFRSEVEETMLLLEPLTGGKGFKLGERRVSFFSLRKNAEGHVAELFFRVLGDSLSHYIAQQVDGQLPRRTIFMIDEFGVLDSKVLVDIILTSREAGLGVIMAAQTPKSLESKGEWAAAEEIIASVGTLILMRTTSAEQLIKLAGTRMVDDPSYTTREGEFHGTTTREKEVLKIDPNELRNLDDGDAFIVTRGWVSRIKSKMVEFNVADFTEEMEDLSVREGAVQPPANNADEEPVLRTNHLKSPI